MTWASESAKDQYLQLINRAVSEPKIFSCFKSMPVFQRVVGVTEDLYARECYKQISTNPEVSKNLPKFALNDTLGTPYLSLARIQVQDADGTTHSKQLGTDTLRFAHTVHLIQKTFGDLTGKTVFEWGSNYGGLAYCILTQWPSLQIYTLKDLGEVRSLSVQYLKAIGFTDWARITDCAPQKTDLFISELALTEYDDETVFSEYDKYAKNAGGLFMRMNFVDDVRKANFLDYIGQDFKVTAEREHPIRAHNYIVIGTK